MSTSSHFDKMAQTTLRDDTSETILTNRNADNGRNTSTQNGNATHTNNHADASTKRPTSVFMKLKTYLLALRPWSLSASLVPTLLGLALAYRSSTPHDYYFVTVILVLFTVITVHLAGNVVNTYFDYVKGIDNRRSDDRTLVDHILSKEEVYTQQYLLCYFDLMANKSFLPSTCSRVDQTLSLNVTNSFCSQITTLGAILYSISCGGFILLSALCPAKPEHLAFLYFCGLSSSFLYTGGIGFKYIALGDLLVLSIFGPISVLYAFFAMTGRWEWSTIYFAIPLALNTEAIVHSNNARDAESDKAAGIVTLAIIIGRSASHVLYAILLFTPYIIFVVLTLKHSIWFVLPLVTLPQAFKIEKFFRSEATMRTVPKETAKLNFYFGILYVIACCGATQLPGLSVERY